MSEAFDLLVIGGGINGAGIARDAAGRGLKVLLVEKDDLAAHTSSASTKLVHGGLRYLEQFEFRLVAEALREREVLLRAAPHIIWPLRFVMPHRPGMRPRWLLRIGLALYDRLGGKGSLPHSAPIDLAGPPHRGILHEDITRGFEYWDCWVEDARLVVLNAVDAQERGAAIAPQTECVALVRGADRWQARVRTASAERTVTARAVVNAAGPWVDAVARLALGQGTPAQLRLVKGSHIVVRRAYAGEHAYLFQQPDKRVVFAIPFERDYTLIGTTDVRFEGSPDRVTISEEETAYLCAAASRYFRSPVGADEIVHTYAGVRPLYDDRARTNAAVTRDYVLELDHAGGAPILSVYGGKITTYRRLAEHALARLGKVLPMAGPWTSDRPLPGGDMANADFARFLWQASERLDWVPPEMLLRLARAYGTRIDRVLDGATSLGELGELFAGDFYEAELRYLARHEFARTADDVLWRRSRLGLHLPPATGARIDTWFAGQQRG